MGAAAGTPSVSFDGDADVGARGPKSPSLLRRIGMFFHIGGKSYNVDGEKKKKRRKVSSGSKEALNADISAEASVKRDDSFTIPDAEFKVPSVGVSSDAAGAAGLTGGISGSAKADTSSSTDANIETPSLGISSDPAIGVSAGMSGGFSQSVEAEALSEVSAKAEANTEASLPSVGGGASMELPSAKVTLPSVNLGADANANESLSTGVSADANLSATAEAGVDVSDAANASSSEIGSFNADVGGKSFNIKMSF